MQRFARPTLESIYGLPWTPVKFVGLTALPYVDDSGNRPRIAWSFRAEGFVNGDLGAKSGPDQKAAA